MRRRVLAGASVFVVLAMAVFAATSMAASDHSVVVEDSFPDEVCGIPGTSTVRFTDLIKETDDSFQTTGMLRHQFTATSTGKSITIRGVGPVIRTETIDEAAGTITITATIIGLLEKISITRGPTLTRDAGTATITTTYALDPQTGEAVGEPLSKEISFLHGPHPEEESDHTLECEVIVPYLLDP